MRIRGLLLTIAYTFVALLIAASFSIAADDLIVSEIIGNPGKYTGEVVSVTGEIEQFSGSTETTMYYILKGTHGGIIQVNTAASVPDVEISKLHIVKGIVYIDQVTRKPFISEQGRTIIDVPQQTNNDQEGGGTDNLRYVLYGLGGLAVLLVLLILVMLARRGSGRKIPQQEPESVAKQTGEASEPKEFKTMVIQPNPTLKFMPGVVEIMSGNDSGKEFQLFGVPRGNENVMVVGQRSNKEAKIALDQQHYPTVSRAQAEFVEKNGKACIRNLSATNITQVNGKPLANDQLVELNFGDTITMGALKLKYKES